MQIKPTINQININFSLMRLGRLFVGKHRSLRHCLESPTSGSYAISSRIQVTFLWIILPSKRNYASPTSQWNQERFIVFC